MASRVQYVLAVTFPVLMACAATSSSEEGPRPYASVITREELRQAGVRTAYEAVQRLRPRWLVVRSGMRSFALETEVVVFQDHFFLGNQDALERIGIDGIYEIRYLDGATAKATLPGIGDRHVQGAIVVHMSPPDGEPDAG